MSAHLFPFLIDHLRVTRELVVSHRIDTRTFASSLCLCLCLCLCQQGLAGTGQSPRRDSQALCLTSSGRVLVFLCDQLVWKWHISLICLLEPWRRQAFAGQPKPRQAGRRLRVGLPTPGKSLKMHRETLPWCSLQNTKAVICERSHIASTTGSADRHTDAVRFSTGPATEWIGPIPVYWEQSGAAYNGCLGSVPAY